MHSLVEEMLREVRTHGQPVESFIVELLKTKFGVLLRVERYATTIVSGFALFAFFLEVSVYHHWLDVAPLIEAMVQILPAFDGLEKVFKASGEDV